MTSDILILLALSDAPRTAVQLQTILAQSTRGSSLSNTRERLGVLRGAGLVYICDRIPPQGTGRATDVYALNGELSPGQCKDVPPWSQLPEEERRARREDVWGGQ